MIMLLTSGIAIVLASLFFVVGSVINFRNSMHRELMTLGAIVGYNSSATIAFGDRADTNKTLRARAIKAEAALQQTRLLMLTSVGRYGDEREAASAGIGCYISKPVRQSRLYNAITNLLDLGTAGEENPQREHVLKTPQFAANVLLVEDNPVNQDVAAAMLESAGCTVTVANNGAEALDTMAQCQFDMIFMDCQMPVMDGYTTTRKIREREGHAVAVVKPRTIVALTAHAMQGDQEQCLAAGMDDYLAKPFNQAQLLVILDRWIGQLKLPDQQGDLPSATPSAPVEAQLPGIDLSVLDSIRALQQEGKPDILAKTIGLYLKSSAVLVVSLRGSVESSDAPGVNQSAHTRKSSSAHLALPY